jgi:major membrane immunogen (membrane-anchored lipoprotein)
MLYRRITVILLVLFTLLSGCSKKAKSEMKTPQKSKEVLSVQTGEKTEQQDGEKDNPVSYESESESIVPYRYNYAQELTSILLHNLKLALLFV